MWVYSKNAFLSIVKHAREPEMLMVRSRFPGHIEEAFPKAKVLMSPDADYTFRATVPTVEVAIWLASETHDIDYTNFKGSISKAGYHNACLSVWTALRRYADNLMPRHLLNTIRPEKKLHRHPA